MFSETPINGESLPPNTLSLTFDDGPGPRTLDIAQYLAEERIEAAFFMVGRHMREFPDTAQSLRKRGHLACNHSFHHFHLTNSFSSIQTLTQEVELADMELGSGSNPIAEPVFFRPPYGAWSPRVAHLFNRYSRVADKYVGPVNWDFGGADFDYWETGKAVEACAAYYERAISRRKNKNGIILLHDRQADSPNPNRVNLTFEMVRLLVPRLLDRGFSFLNLQKIPTVRRATPNQLPPGENISCPVKSADGPSAS